MMKLFVAALGLCATAVVSSNFPPAPENVTTIQSKFGNNVTISYKEVRG